MVKTVTYKFYYLYMDDVYGVMKESQKGYLVKMLKTGETEIIEKKWLLKQYEKGKVDLSKNGSSLEEFKEEFLYEKT